MPKPIGAQPGVGNIQLPQRQGGGAGPLLQMIAAGPQGRPMQAPSQPAMRGGWGQGIGQGIQQAGAGIGEGFREAGRRKFATQERQAGQEFVREQNREQQDLQMALEQARIKSAQQTNKHALLVSAYTDMLNAVDTVNQMGFTAALGELKASNQRVLEGKEQRLPPEMEAARINAIVDYAQKAMQPKFLLDALREGAIPELRQYAVRRGGPGEDPYVLEALGGEPTGETGPNLAGLLDLLDRGGDVDLDEAQGANMLAALPRLINPVAYDPERVMQDVALDREMEDHKVRIHAATAGISRGSMRRGRAIAEFYGLVAPELGEDGIFDLAGMEQTQASDRVLDSIRELATAFEDRGAGSALLPQDMSTWILQRTIPEGSRLAQYVEASKLGQADAVQLSPEEAHVDAAYINMVLNTLRDFRATHLIPGGKYENPWKLSRGMQEKLTDFTDKAVMDFGDAALALAQSGMLSVFRQEIGIVKQTNETLDILSSGKATKAEKVAAVEDLAEEVVGKWERERGFDEAFAEGLQALGYAQTIQAVGNPALKSFYRPEIDQALREHMQKQLTGNIEGFRQRREAQPQQTPGAYGPRQQVQPKPGTEQQYGPASVGWVGG